MGSDEYDAVRELELERGFLEMSVLSGLGALTWVLLRRGEAITIDSLLAEGHRRKDGAPEKSGIQALFDQERIGATVAILEDMKAGRPIRMGLSIEPFGPDSNLPTQ